MLVARGPRALPRRTDAKRRNTTFRARHRSTPSAPRTTAPTTILRVDQRLYAYQDICVVFWGNTGDATVALRGSTAVAPACFPDSSWTAWF